MLSYTSVLRINRTCNENPGVKKIPCILSGTFKIVIGKQTHLSHWECWIQNTFLLLCKIIDYVQCLILLLLKITL